MWRRFRDTKHEIVCDTTRINSLFSDFRVVSRTISCRISKSPLHFIPFLTVQQLFIYRNQGWWWPRLDTRRAATRERSTRAKERTTTIAKFEEKCSSMVAHMSASWVRILVYWHILCSTVLYSVQ